jgi:hypothetical protein
LQGEEKEEGEPLQSSMNQESVCSRIDLEGHKKKAHGGVGFLQYNPLPNEKTYLIYMVDLVWCLKIK